MRKTNLEEIRTKKDALSEIVQNLTMKLYEEAAKAQQAAQADGAAGPADDNVVDAEFTEVNDDDKK